MDIVKIQSSKIPHDVIEKAVNVLKQGGIVVYPTDTAYGLGADALNEDAVGRIFIIKKRIQKPLPVIVANFTMLKQVAVTNPLGLKLGKKYWPAPLTIIFKKQPQISSALTLGLPTIGVKIPNSPVALALVRALGRPITTTSANLSGMKNNYTIDDVLRQFRDTEPRPDLLIDAGTLPEIAVSTVVDSTKGKPIVMREGPVKIAI